MTTSQPLTVEALLDTLRQNPQQIAFADVIATIAAHYDYTPTRFTNGVGADMVVNEAGTNEGSCRIFGFAALNGLSESETLALFGDFYRRDVLENPAGTDHANIRTFIRHGWSGIRFDGQPLKARA